MECEAGRRHAGIGIKELEVTAVQLDTTTGVTVATETLGEMQLSVGDAHKFRPVEARVNCLAQDGSAFQYPSRKVAQHMSESVAMLNRIGRYLRGAARCIQTFLLEFWGQRRSRHETGCQVDEWKRLSMGERELAEELINQTVDDCVVEQSCMR